MTERTDRELLELAAKAYGLRSDEWVYITCGRAGFMRELAVHGVPHAGYQGPEWNPLEDDGDALRLAVALKIRIGFRPQAYADTPTGVRCFGAVEDHGADPCAAARRAIVRAAAAMAEGGEQ